MIHVIATVTLRPGMRERWLAEFRKLMPLARAEKGCIDYVSAVDAVTDVAVQSRTGEDKVVIVEAWTSVSAFKTYLAAPYLAEYGA
jgi:quinol monooxygenase YgiN